VTETTIPIFKQTLEKPERAIKNKQFKETGNIGYTGHRTRTKNTTQKKTKQMSNTNPTKNRWWTQMFVKGKQFLPLIRHSPFYSYRQCVLGNTIRKQIQIT